MGLFKKKKKRSKSGNQSKAYISYGLQFINAFSTFY